MSGIGSQTTSPAPCWGAHHSPADGAVGTSSPSSGTQGQVLWGSSRTPEFSSNSTGDGGHLNGNYFSYLNQVPSTPRHSLNDAHSKVQSARGLYLQSCSSGLHTRMKCSAERGVSTTGENSVVGRRTPAPDTSHHTHSRDPPHVNRVTAEGRTTSNASQPVHKGNETGNSSQGKQVHPWTSIPRSDSLSSLPYGWSARPPHAWGLAFPSDELCKQMARQKHLHEVSGVTSQRVSSTGRTPGGHAAAEVNFQRDVKFEVFPPDSTPQEEVPSVAKTLLHERVERDLHRLLQELLRSPTGRLELQSALHASVECGFLRGVSSTTTDIVAATASDPLLRGFWSIPCSEGHVEVPSNEVQSSQVLQQLWRAHISPSHRTREDPLQQGDSQSAHARAHNRPTAPHFCRILCSTGELVHVPYVPYKQSISKGSSCRLKGDRA